jgi:hypothetical protein
MHASSLSSKPWRRPCYKPTLETNIDVSLERTKHIITAQQRNYNDWHSKPRHTSNPDSGMLTDSSTSRHDVSQEHKRLEQIKTAKIVQLRKAGVPSKYLAELETFSVSH